MKTQRELLEEHRKELDRAWRARYPNGQFVLQQWDRRLGGPWIALHWNPKRNTSHVKYRGVSVRQYRGEESIIVESYQNNSFGKVRNYDSMEKLLAAATRANASAELITKFLAEHLKFLRQ